MTNSYDDEDGTTPLSGLDRDRVWREWGIDLQDAPRTGADLDLLVETAKNYAYGRGGFDLPQAEVRADWTLTSPDAGAICGQAWSSDMYDYCTGCGVLLNEDCESAVPGWCVWCAGEE